LMAGGSSAGGLLSGSESPAAEVIAAPESGVDACCDALTIAQQPMKHVTTAIRDTLRNSI
jgi:hypothetical protein